MNRRSAIAVALAFALGACTPGSLFEDPSFDLWCGGALCSPWESSGRISRVATWHRSDFGVELGDGSTLSQLSKQPIGSCIGLDLIADVSPAARVSISLDFNDDGEVEFDQLIPESHWAKLSYAVPAPLESRSVRITFSKSGHGHAVVAQIGAHNGGDCGESAPLPAKNREDGVICDTAKQCASGACAMIYDAYRAENRRVCGSCDESHECPSDQRCGTAVGKIAQYPACVAQQQELGASCDDDSQCTSGQCREVLGGAKACVQCSLPEDCSEGESCELQMKRLGMTRVCTPPHSRAIGWLCSSDALCESGLCSNLVCSECDDSHACSEGACTQVTTGSTTWLTVGLPKICVRDPGAQMAGEVCDSDEDCASGDCDHPGTVCGLCMDAECEDVNLPRCAIRRQPIGHCR